MAGEALGDNSSPIKAPITNHLVLLNFFFPWHPAFWRAQWDKKGSYIWTERMGG